VRYSETGKKNGNKETFRRAVLTAS